MSGALILSERAPANFGLDKVMTGAVYPRVAAANRRPADGLPVGIR